MATKGDVTKALLLLQFLPNSPIMPINQEQVINTFVVILEDLPAETVQAAAVQLLSEATFFPTPGQLRDRAMDLQMLALGIPTPAEAWGMVLSARQYVQSAHCQAGADLRETYIEHGSRAALNAYSDHTDHCDICKPGGYREIYSSPAVGECVKLLGGRDVLLTDNPVADRARFIEAYREIASRERMKNAMLPQVRAYVASNTPAALSARSGAAVKQLTDRLEAKR